MTPCSFPGRRGNTTQEEQGGWEGQGLRTSFTNMVASDMGPQRRLDSHEIKKKGDTQQRYPGKK